MIVTIVNINNNIKIFSSVITHRYMSESNTLKIETKKAMLTVDNVRHFNVFLNNGKEIFSAQNLDKGFD